MKIKIKCSVSELLKQGLPLVEAERLSGNLFEAIKPGCNQYYQVSGIDRDGDACVWLFGDSEVELVSEKAPSLDLTKPVQMRNGCPVEIKYIDKSLEYPINGIMTCKNGKRFAASWRIDGTIYSDGSPCENDLVQSPEPLIEGWLNLYDSTTHPTKEEADEYADADRTACIKVSYRKGEGL